jgi:ATP-binding cassette subfamily B protein/subfamily B ATP-binding cassette protein MsbA
MWPFIKENKIAASFIVIFKICSMCITLYLPFIYGYYMNQVIMEKNMNHLPYVLIGYVILFLLETIFTVGFKFFETQFVNRLKIDLKSQLLETYGAMDFKEFEKTNAADIRIRIEEDTNAICGFYMNHCVNFIFAIVGMVIMIKIIFELSFHLTIFGIMMIGLSFYITKVLSKKIKKTSAQYRGNQGEFENIIKDILYNWKEVKTYNLEEQSEVLLEKKWSVLSKLLMKNTFFQYIHGAIVAFNLVFVTRMSLYFMGGILIIQNMMSVANMLVFMNYYEKIFSYVQSISDSIIGLSSETYQMDGIIDVLKPKYRKVYKEHIPDSIEGNLQTEDVSFRYSSSECNVLEKVNLKIGLNKKTAIVGKSGHGKSTLAKILLGLYEPDDGNIYLGDVNLNKIETEKRNKIINAVMQDPVLLNISILDNIRLANTEATMEEIDCACKIADIFDFIQNTPDKYNTIIGERGVKLSGGQRQRIAIARTLLLDPKIIIFDEATSSVDNESESNISKAIEKLSQSKTIISIAHRFSTIAMYEEAVILQEGRTLQMSMNELMKSEELASSIFPQKGGN